MFMHFCALPGQSFAFVCIIRGMRLRFVALWCLDRAVCLHLCAFLRILRGTLLHLLCTRHYIIVHLLVSGRDPQGSISPNASPEKA